MRRTTPVPGSRSLTPQQHYLLQRIPSTYDMGVEERPEPADVKKAKAVLERWGKQDNLRKCQDKKRNEALIRKAKEAVYFETPEKALAIVKQCERLLKGCPV